jgi:hypothetical protein
MCGCIRKGGWRLVGNLMKSEASAREKSRALCILLKFRESVVYLVVKSAII